jgi:hypothetical protein
MRSSRSAGLGSCLGGSVLSGAFERDEPVAGRSVVKSLIRASSSGKWQQSRRRQGGGAVTMRRQGSRIEGGGGSIQPFAIAAARSGLNLTLLWASSRQKPFWVANHWSIDGWYFS